MKNFGLRNNIELRVRGDVHCRIVYKRTEDGKLTADAVGSLFYHKHEDGTVEDVIYMRDKTDAIVPYSDITAADKHDAYMKAQKSTETAIVTRKLSDAQEISQYTDSDIFIALASSNDMTEAMEAGVESFKGYKKVIFWKVFSDRNGGQITGDEAALIRKMRATTGAEIGTPIHYTEMTGKTAEEKKEIFTQDIQTISSPRKNKFIQSFEGITRRDRHDVERISTHWTGLNAYLGGGIPRGQITLFTSKSGMGKSTMSLQLAGSAVEQGHRVTIYSGEMGPEDIEYTVTSQIAGRENMESFIDAFGYDRTRVTDEAYEDLHKNFIIPHFHCFNTYGSRQPWSDLKQAIEDEVADGVDFFIFDNVMTLVAAVMAEERGCTELQAQSMVAIWMERELAIKHNVYVLLIAHMRKGSAGAFGGDKNDEVLGSSAIINAAGVVLFYEKQKPGKGEEADDFTTKRILSLTKNRLMGRTYYDGWQMDFDYDTLRTYQVLRSGHRVEWKSEWEKEKEKEKYKKEEYKKEEYKKEEYKKEYKEEYKEEKTEEEEDYSEIAREVLGAAAAEEEEECKFFI